VVAVEWSQGIEDAWADVMSFLPRFLGFVLILVVGYLIVKAISKAADAALERAGFDRAVERGGIKKALAKSQYDASTIVSKIVFYALFLFVVQLAFGVFGENPVSDMIDGVVAYLPKVVAAIVIVVVMSAIAAAAKTMIESLLGGMSYGSTLANVTAGGIVAVAVFMALSQLEIAPAIVNGLFYGLLALVVGSGIIAIGGGGIKPMQQVWERSIERVEQEAPAMREAAQARKQELQGLTVEAGDVTQTQERISAKGSVASSTSTTRARTTRR
jgi:hypothetical protein